MHVPAIVRSLGSLRFISARPLERMIGKVKSQIKSRSSPAENVRNVVASHFSDVYLHDSSEVNVSESFDTDNEKRQHTIADILSRLQVEENEIELVTSLIKLFANDRVRLLPSIVCARNGQEIKLHREKETWVVYDDEGNLRVGVLTGLFVTDRDLKVAFIKSFLSIQSSSTALLKLQTK